MDADAANAFREIIEFVAAKRRRDGTLGRQSVENILTICMQELNRAARISGSAIPYPEVEDEPDLD